MNKLNQFFDKLFKLRMDVAEEAVNKEKTKTEKKVQQVKSTIKKQNKLQSRVMEKTTTYYLGKGMGVIK